MVFQYSTMSRLIRHLFLFLLIVFSGSRAAGQSGARKAAIEITQLIATGETAMTKGDYPKALQLFTKAELLAEANDMQRQLMLVKFDIGKVYGEIHSLGDALKYYNDALNIIMKYPDLEEKGVTISINIGGLYMDQGDYLMGLEYYQKSYAKAKKLKSEYNMVLSGINISDVYNTMGSHDLARKYLDEIKDLKMDNIAAQTWKINYAESYFKEGRLKEADKIMDQVWGNVDNTDENHCYICVVKLLSQISNAKGDVNEAIKYAKEGLKNARSVKDRAQMYDLLAGIHFENWQYEKAYLYKDTLSTLNDSLSKIVQSNLFATNKVRLKIQDYVSEARYNKERREDERNLFILIIVLGIILFYFIYRSQKNNIVKQKQQNIIAENKQKIYELELNKLSNDIAEKNRRLSAKALYLSGRNELIEEVINALDQIPEIQQASVHDHIRVLREHLRSDNEWGDFITYFEQVNPSFLRKLQEQHPQLNSADVRFICYLYMNLDLKEISSIFNITIEAARKRKQRVAKKMGIDIDMLNEYILKINLIPQ